jgi:hypothetical protein
MSKLNQHSQTVGMNETRPLQKQRWFDVSQDFNFGQGVSNINFQNTAGNVSVQE